MLTRDQERLEIFENFSIDYNLPKYNKNSGNESNSFISIGNSTGGSLTIDDQDVINTGDKNKTGIKHIFLKIKSLFKYKKEKDVKMTPYEFFKSVKNSTEELEIIEERSSAYEKMLINAKETGQTALREKLEDSISLIRSESQLIATGYKTVITEQQVVDFYKKSEKGLRLDYIRNFTRVIPNEIIKKKSELDQHEIFDNYVVLHYDPNETAFSKTKIEKDPILFGVLKNSNKLYFVADWIDEVCDLTLEKLIDEYGEDAINKNDLDVKIYNYE